MVLIWSDGQVCNMTKYYWGVIACLSRFRMEDVNVMGNMESIPLRSEVVVRFGELTMSHPIRLSRGQP